MLLGASLPLREGNPQPLWPEPDHPHQPICAACIRRIRPRLLISKSGTAFAREAFFFGMTRTRQNIPLDSAIRFSGFTHNYDHTIVPRLVRVEKSLA